MDLVFPLVIALPVACLLACGMTPSHWANRHVRLMRRAVLNLSLAAIAAALLSGVLLVVYGPLDVSVRLMARFPISLGIYFDSLAAIMLLLVSFVGHVIVRYATRYLDGEATQGRFMRWISFTLGAVLLLIIASNLVMFTTAWILTSFGLHQLLTHYPDRPAGLLAARKKFVISRLGDAMLFVALLLTYRAFGSFDYADIFASAQAMQADSSGSGMLSLIGLLYVFGAMTKSAQFPFHSWLPDTMETPTPVSAFMHAGIINAGGFLVIRLSPLIAQSHIALDALALVGALTAVFGSVVMLTQSSIKRSLAYSTIAQMGLMMLQCGLGAFSAALLHIVAHSLYKAHAFLNSGSVLQVSSKDRPVLGRPTLYRSLVGLAAALSVAGVFVGTLIFVLGSVTDHKAGIVTAALILTLSLTQLLWNSFVVGQSRVAWSGLAGAALVSVGYGVAWLAIDRLLNGSVSQLVVPASLFDQVVLVLVATGFVAAFALQVALVYCRDWPAFRSLYVHASNGFYFDIAAHKLTTQLWKMAPAKTLGN
jgi:NAD(P)H-quinone oxidoreductase subunit 5